jgi:hypothetical protein
MDKACVLRTSNSILQALGEVVERPAGFPNKFGHVFLSFLTFLVNIWPSSLRTAAIKMNSGQQGCGVRTCGLFH